MNTNRTLINSAKTKKMLLQLSKDLRGGKFTRVSDETLDAAADKYAASLRQIVADQPSVGKTL